ncbi:macrophage migration inhibitory factor-like [Mytilus californianus]|uniref:macrophage migration inhibitory factor-like n=1 Tax=Mytilus californianus TaxID=6549 RepID=UPI002246C709|nr:macrophage migration inhibitory factor-like [Mytilus californianus]
MPKAIIHTNLKDKDVPEGFELRVTQKMGEVFEFPIEVIYVTLTTGDRMSHNGSSDPMVFVDMVTVNKFSEENNPSYSRQFMKFFSDELKIPLHRVLIQYHDSQMEDFGCKRQSPEYKDERYFLDNSR